MTTHRPTGIALILFGSFTILTVLMVVIGLALPQENRFTPGQTGTIVFLLGLVLVLAMLVWRSSVRFDDRRIVVTNFVRRHEFSWSDVSAISMPDGAPWPTLVTSDDERVMLFAIQGSDKASAAKALAGLRSHL